MCFIMSDVNRYSSSPDVCVCPLCSCCVAAGKIKFPVRLNVRGCLELDLFTEAVRETVCQISTFRNGCFGSSFILLSEALFRTEN